MSLARTLAALPLVLAASNAAADLRSGPPGSAPSTLVITTPVVGGSMVPPGKWPDAVAVLGPKGSCTGTLVAPDVVITAGHCAGIEPNEVVVDTTNYNGTGGTRAGVTSITAYPNYQHSYDIAVVMLDTPIANVQPRAVGAKCSYAGFGADTMVHLVGFGLTQEDGGGANTTLHEAMAPVLDPDCSGGNGCRDAAGPDGEFVAGGGGSDSCFGDSGGPVYLDTPCGPIVIASVSRGLADSATPCGGAGIYVRTDKVIQWIEQTSGRTIEKDSCAADYSLESEVPDGASDSAGCSAGGAGSLGALFILVPIGRLRRRRVR